MIASIAGTVVGLAPDGAVIEVGGVGLLVLASPALLAGMRIGEPARLATSLVVRETELTLYGFADDDAKATFELLQTASGVGPKLAQAVLAVHDPDDVRRAVATENLDALCLVPGIGKKGAQRLVLELKDRLGSPSFPGLTTARRASEPATVGQQLHAALVSLGYTAREADEGVAAVATVPLEATAEGEALPLLLRQALAALRRS